MIRAEIPLDELQRLAAMGIPDPVIAEHFGVSSRTILRRRTEHGIPSTWTPPAPIFDHGTEYRYRRGCTCQDCRDAHADLQAEYRAKYRAQTRLAPAQGTPWTAREDAILQDPTYGTLPTRAARLGRTYEGAKCRLDKLRREANK